MKLGLIVALSFLLIACAALHTAAKTALDASDLTCVFGSELTDADALADFCKFAKPLVPLLRDLIGQREAAKRAGVMWPGARDAGGSPQVRSSAGPAHDGGPSDGRTDSGSDPRP